MKKISCMYIFSLIIINCVIGFIYNLFSMNEFRTKSPKPLNVNEKAQFKIEPVEQSYQDELEINKSLRVLDWTGYFRKHFGASKEILCPKSNCVLIYDRKYLNTSDAIVFNWYSIESNDIPSVLNNQKLVLFNREAPFHSRLEFEYLKLMRFDWFMSYNKDSDINFNYGKIVECDTNWKQRHSFEEKTKSIAWFVSHCKTNSNRETYVKILEQYIDVDIYGKCGPLICGRIGDKYCYEMIAKNYKFYLAFENSICKEYVTEKLFNILEYDIIPIVLGGANYSSLLPENSYIDVMNFSSPKHLSEYLRIVSNDKTLYNSYFKWKNNYCISFPKMSEDFCKICEHLRYHRKEINISNKFEELKNWITESNCSRMMMAQNETINLVDFISYKNKGTSKNCSH